MPGIPHLFHNETSEALSVLADFSLVARTNDDWSPVPVHALAQRTIRELPENDDRRAETARKFADAIEEA